MKIPIFLIFAIIFGSIESSRSEVAIVESRKLTVPNMNVPTTVTILARICCASDEYFDEPTWHEKEKFVVNLKVRMSKGSKIAMFNGNLGEFGEIEEFSCEKPGCIDDRLIKLYHVSGLKKNIGSFRVKYYCEGDFFQSSIKDSDNDKYVGIHVLKGQVKIDDTSSDRISCMPKTPGDNIWTAEGFRSNGVKKNERNQRAKAPAEEGRTKNPPKQKTILDQQVSASDDINPS